MKLEGAKVVVVGMARSGLAAVELLRAKGATVVIELRLRPNSTRAIVVTPDVGDGVFLKCIRHPHPNPLSHD